MAAFFTKSIDRYIKILGALLSVGVVLGVAGAYFYFAPSNIKTGYSPKQPVPYSHKLHAGNLGMDCYYCHSTVYKAAYAAIPSTETCMNCHARVKPTSSLLEPVRRSYATGEPVPWVKVHRLADYVYFNHSAHINVGVSCVSCHGRVDQMIEVRQVKPLNMNFCLDCHRNPAPNLRPASQVTNLAWEPEDEREPAEVGREIIAEKHVNPPVNCSGCHR